MRFSPYLFLIVATLLLFGNTLILPPGKIIYGGDLNDQFYFWKSFLVENIKNGVIPFWNPYNFSGTPFLAHPSLAPFYPFNLIFFFFPINLAFSIFLFLHLLLAGFFMYGYARKKLDILPSLISATIFAFSGFFAARIYSGHIDIISTVVWIPLVFGAVTEAFTSQKKKDIFVAIFALTMEILAGYHFVVILTLELIFLFLAFHTALEIFHRKENFSRIVSKFILLVLITLASYGLSAVQFLPTLELVKHSIRAKGLSYNLATWGSYSLEMFKLFLSPFSFGNPFPERYSYQGPGPNYFELSFFIGILPIVLFMVYSFKQIIDFIIRKETDKNFIFLLLSILFFTLLAMGNYFPLHKLLFDFFPPYRLFRFPAQHLIMVVFLLAAGIGFVSQSAKFLFLRVLILLLIIIELLNYDKNFLRVSHLPTASFDPRLQEMLLKNGSEGRLLPDYTVVSGVRQFLDFEAVSFYQIPTTSGYNPIVLENYYHFIDLLNKTRTSSIPYFNVEIPPPNLSSPLINFLNIRYILVDTNSNTLQGEKPGKCKLLIDNPKYRLYENLNSLPRFFLVNNIGIYQSSHELEEDLLARDPDFSKMVLLTKKDLRDFSAFNLSCPEDNLGLVEVVTYSPNQILLRVRANCNSFLSSSEVYYPGWKAKIDENATRVYKSNLAFRSIYIPKGEHVVKFYYDPTIYYLGGVISLFTVIILIYIFRKYER